MRDFDFRGWRGKNRRLIAIFLTEDSIFEELQRLAVLNLTAGYTTSDLNEP
jgi:hypothetical protein